MKKFLAIALIAASFTACDGDKKEDSMTTSDTTTTVVPTADTVTTVTTTTVDTDTTTMVKEGENRADTMKRNN